MNLLYFLETQYMKEKPIQNQCSLKALRAHTSCMHSFISKALGVGCFAA